MFLKALKKGNPSHQYFDNNFQIRNVTARNVTAQLLKPFTVVRFKPDRKPCLKWLGLWVLSLVPT